MTKKEEKDLKCHNESLLIGTTEKKEERRRKTHIRALSRKKEEGSHHTEK